MEHEEESIVLNIPSDKKIFIILISILTIIGAVMIYSSSYLLAKDVYGNSSHFFVRQIQFILLSIVVAFVVSKTKVSFWLNYSYAINAICAVVVLLTLIPGIGVTVKGASRWLNLFGHSFQPGEVLKYTCLFGSIAYFENFKSYSTKQRVFNSAYILLPMGLVLAQPDFGTFMICFAGMFFVCYLSTFSRKIFYGLIPVGLIAAGALLVAQPYRVERLKTFLDPWQSPQGSGFQIIQSWMGFANGSLFGKGLGNSYEKLFYLPEAHNDFILSVIGEEAGFVGVVTLVGLFLGLIYFGFKLASSVTNRSASLLASSLIFTIGVQALLNMAVVLGLLPTKGLNLPFISYGGSSLIANFFAIGLMLSCLKETTETATEEKKTEPQQDDIHERLKRFKEQRSRWQQDPNSSKGYTFPS
jgi:cell division protein FtsW